MMYDKEIDLTEVSISKSLYIDTLSQADNRNIKKLYNLMNLSRREHNL